MRVKLNFNISSYLVNYDLLKDLIICYIYIFNI